MTVGRPFQRGGPGGPGRPKGSRNRLSEAFLDTLYADFQANGAAAIEAARGEDPLGYLRLLASLLPQKLEVSRAAADATDGELLAVIRGAGEEIEPLSPATPTR